MRPDVLPPFCPLPNVLCGIVWRWAGARLCGWNEADVLAPRRFRRALVRRALADTPVVVSNAVGCMTAGLAVAGTDLPDMREAAILRLAANRGTDMPSRSRRPSAAG